MSLFCYLFTLLSQYRYTREKSLLQFVKFLYKISLDYVAFKHVQTYFSYI